jgi:lipoprotein-anchoring transpeptidase ErfK/SrfK
MALHSRARHRRWILGVVLLAVLATAGIVLAIHPSGANHRNRQATLVLADALSTSPADHATGVALDTPVVVSTRTGRLTSVSVAPENGPPLSGAFDLTAAHWTAVGGLAPSTTYVVRARVVGRSGAAVTTTSSFSTVSPTALVTTTVWPQSGLTVGVGQPIVLTLSHPVTDPAARARLLTHLQLATSVPTEVGAYWFSPTELHLRPRAYWQTGEKVSLAASLAGWDAGGGSWGSGSPSVTFTIGDARISTVDLASHQMTVTDNGATVATYPVSAGSDQYPTMNGTHIVLDRESQVRMVSSTIGIPVNSPGGYDETVYWDVHISDSGEYVHAAPWSVGAQGNTNVSHGCVNLSPANAEQFMNLSRVGDVVMVVNGIRPAAPGDHGVMDWGTPWSSFTPVVVGTLAT